MAIWTGFMRSGIAILLLIAVASVSTGIRAQLHPFPNDGLSCHGNLVQLEDTMQVVIRKCGQPQLNEPFCRRGRGGSQVCWESWLYIQDSGTLPRRVVFDRRGQVTGIIVGSRFD